MIVPSSSSPFVLLDNSRIEIGTNGQSQGKGEGKGNVEADDHGSLLFQNAIEIVSCSDPDAVPHAFATLEAALAQGHHIAGWCAYELGYVFEPKLRGLLPPSPRPLLWFGIFPALERLTARAVSERLDPIRHNALDPCVVRDLRPSLDASAYAAAIGRIHDYLNAGDIYQANFTFPLTFTMDGTTEALFRRLRRSQPVAYGAWIHDATGDIISLSPELFIEKRGTTLTARPMKGTAPRGRDQASDDDAARTLMTDPKQRAENVMIVDLLRNDLSRIAAPASVETPHLFTVERYRSLLQMTSTVTAEVAPDLPLVDFFQSLYPCGSVTGAPKIRAMEIIRALEQQPRGVYTGTIGYVTPDRDFCFSVPIRTMTLTQDRPRRWHGQLGIGSGIVVDSVAADEYAECLLKARFLTHPVPEFDLIETLLWSKDNGYQRRDAHLTRLAASAAFFGFRLDRTGLEHKLDDFARDLPHTPQRIRILCDMAGNTTITAAALPAVVAGSDLPIARLSSIVVEPSNPLLYHKTSARGFYQAALKQAQAKGPCFDAILTNIHGEVTEGSFTSVFVERDGLLLTPPLSTGVLPGVLRAELLASGRAQEARLTPADLYAADRVYLGNSLRGLIAVRVVAD